MVSEYNIVISAINSNSLIILNDLFHKGIFMITAWILLAGTGIFFASWMKPTLPNGEWFQVCVYYCHVL